MRGLALLFGAALCSVAFGDANVPGVVAFPRGRKTPHVVQAVGGDGGIRRAPVQADGSFLIPHVAPGSYHVEVISSEYVYPTYRLDVSRKSKDVYRWKFRDPLGTDVKSPVTIAPVALPTFFHARPRLNIFAYTPMLLTAALPLLMMYLMNTLKDQRDALNRDAAERSAEGGEGADEMEKQIREMQEKLQGWTSSLFGQTNAVAAGMGPMGNPAAGMGGPAAPGGPGSPAAPGAGAAAGLGGVRPS